MSASAFRFLVLATIALQLLGSFVDLLFPSLIPASLSSAVDALPLSPAFENPWFVGTTIVVAIAMCAAVVGLLFFKRWARALCLGSTVVSFGLFPVLGPGVYSGLAGAIQELSAVLWGAALATAFFSPLRERFASAQNDA